VSVERIRRSCQVLAFVLPVPWLSTVQLTDRGLPLAPVEGTVTFETTRSL
jgi:hypothetical protein